MLKSDVVRRYLILPFLALAAGAGAQPEHVVLVSIDGLATYQLDDRELVLPNIRKLIETGVWAKSSETVYPSLTHPSHTTLVTGVMPRVHGVVGNRVVNRETGERFHFTNKPHTESVRVPTIFNAEKQKGLITAAFYWPENYQDPSIDYNIPEVFDGDTADPKAADPAFLEELRKASIPIDFTTRGTWIGIAKASRMPSSPTRQPMCSNATGRSFSRFTSLSPTRSNTRTDPTTTGRKRRSPPRTTPSAS